MDQPIVNVDSTGFSFIPNLSNTTWLIIVLVLGLFLLSCMTNRCRESFLGYSQVPRCNTKVYESFQDPINRFSHPNGEFIETFNDTTDNIQDFVPPYAYSINVMANCLPGEKDHNGSCTKEGCPVGMERGAGIGADYCYPRCAPGYESDGTGRCYKTCPEGYTTQGDNCVRPKHTFKKDVVPCKGCIAQNPVIVPPVLPRLDGPQTVDIVGPVVMNTGEVRPPKGYGVIETNYLQVVEPFEQVHSSKPQSAPPQNMQNKSVWRVEDRVFMNELPCPLGYTLSGNMCYENCPTNYTDTGNDCIIDSYAVDRPSYDRGSGVPYASKRSKYAHIKPMTQCQK